MNRGIFWSASSYDLAEMADGAAFEAQVQAEMRRIMSGGGLGLGYPTPAAGALPPTAVAPARITVPAVSPSSYYPPPQAQPQPPQHSQHSQQPHSQQPQPPSSFGFGRSGFVDGRMSPTGRPDVSRQMRKTEQHEAYRRDLAAQIHAKEQQHQLQQHQAAALSRQQHQKQQHQRALSPSSGSTAQLFGGLGMDRETSRMEARRKAEQYAAELRQQVVARTLRKSGASGQPSAHATSSAATTENSMTLQNGTAAASASAAYDPMSRYGPSQGFPGSRADLRANVRAASSLLVGPGAAGHPRDSASAAAAAAAAATHSSSASPTYAVRPHATLVDPAELESRSKKRLLQQQQGEVLRQQMREKELAKAAAIAKEKAQQAKDDAHLARQRQQMASQPQPQPQSQSSTAAPLPQHALSPHRPAAASPQSQSRSQPQLSPEPQQRYIPAAPLGAAADSLPRGWPSQDAPLTAAAASAPSPQELALEAAMRRIAELEKEVVEVRASSPTGGLRKPEGVYAPAGPGVASPQFAVHPSNGGSVGRTTQAQFAQQQHQPPPLRAHVQPPAAYPRWREDEAAAFAHQPRLTRSANAPFSGVSMPPSHFQQPQPQPQPQYEYGGYGRYGGGGGGAYGATSTDLDGSLYSDTQFTPMPAAVREEHYAAMGAAAVAAQALRPDQHAAFTPERGFGFGGGGDLGLSGSIDQSLDLDSSLASSVHLVTTTPTMHRVPARRSPFDYADEGDSNGTIYEGPSQDDDSTVELDTSSLAVPIDGMVTHGAGDDARFGPFGFAPCDALGRSLQDITEQSEESQSLMTSFGSVSASQSSMLLQRSALGATPTAAEAAAHAQLYTVMETGAPSAHSSPMLPPSPIAPDECDALSEGADSIEPLSFVVTDTLAGTVTIYPTDGGAVESEVTGQDTAEDDDDDNDDDDADYEEIVEESMLGEEEDGGDPDETIVREVSEEEGLEERSSEPKGSTREPERQADEITDEDDDEDEGEEDADASLVIIAPPSRSSSDPFEVTNASPVARAAKSSVGGLGISAGHNASLFFDASFAASPAPRPPSPQQEDDTPHHAASPVSIDALMRSRGAVQLAGTALVSPTSAVPAGAASPRVGATAAPLAGEAEAAAALPPAPREWSDAKRRGVAPGPESTYSYRNARESRALAPPRSLQEERDAMSLLEALRLDKDLRRRSEAARAPATFGDAR